MQITCDGLMKFKLYQRDYTNLPKGKADRHKKALKAAVYKEEICHYCGFDFSLKLQNRKKTIDHVHPKSKGGKIQNGNIVMACNVCNKAKGVMSYDEFLISAELLTIKNQLRNKE